MEAIFNDIYLLSYDSCFDGIYFVATRAIDKTLHVIYNSATIRWFIRGKGKNNELF